MSCPSLSAKFRVIPLLGESATAYNNMGQELLAQFFHPSAVNNFILAGLRNQQKPLHGNLVTISPLGSKLYDISLSISELDPFQSLYNALHVKAPFAPCTFWTNRLRVVSEARRGKAPARARCVRALSIQRLEGSRPRFAADAGPMQIQWWEGAASSCAEAVPQSATRDNMSREAGCCEKGG